MTAPAYQDWGVMGMVTNVMMLISAVIVVGVVGWMTWALATDNVPESRDQAQDRRIEELEQQIDYLMIQMEGS